MTYRTKNQPNAPAAPMYGGADLALYAADMVRRILFGMQEFRTALRARMEAAEKHGEHTVVAKRGKPVGAYVPIEWYREAAKAMNDPTEF